MIESVNQDKYFQFKELTEEEKKKRGILCRLYGDCADIIADTRNGRHYSEKLWEKVFNDPIVKERIERGGIFGEIEHPLSRSEVDPEKIAISLPELPKKGKNGKLIAYFDILDTPCGKIAYQLAKYGYKWGVSSRGEGDIKESVWDDKQEVDPDTYTFYCFDLVSMPAVASSKMTMVESLSTKTIQNKSLIQSLTEAIDKASDKDKKIMVELLESLKIDYKPNKVDNKSTTKTIAAEDNGADVVKNLQEALKQNKSLQSQLKVLQEKLSVCNAKEITLVEETKAYKAKVESLNEEKKLMEQKVTSLTESLSQNANTVEKQNKQIQILSKKCNTQSTKQKTLNESLITNDKKIKLLESKIENERVEAEKKVTSLNEKLEEVKQDSILLKQNYDKKLKKAETIVEHYKKVAITASNKYIEAKAKMIGVNSSDIKSRLNEGYSFNDIDKVCEDLQSYQLKINSLPFNINQGNNVKVKIKESYEPIKPKNRCDDDIDSSLINLANKF